MILEIKLPSPGESINEVQIAKWMKQDGDYVEKDEEIAEIDSDKATLALTAEADGVLIILVKEGETAAVGAVACTIRTVTREQSEIILYDIASHIILKEKFTKCISLSTERLAKGVYLYEVSNKNGISNKGKFVKD